MIWAMNPAKEERNLRQSPGMVWHVEVQKRRVEVVKLGRNGPGSWKETRRVQCCTAKGRMPQEGRCRMMLLSWAKEWEFSPGLISVDTQSFDGVIRSKTRWKWMKERMRETQVQSLGQEDPLEKEMATHPSILAWIIPWTEEPDRLQSMGSQRVGHDWATSQNKTKQKIRTKT